MDRAQVERVDREIVRLARGQGRVRLQVGAGLAELVRQGWHRELGFSSLAAYAYERLSLAGRTASETRVVARRLAGLPALRRALSTGRIGWSTAELLARHATPDTEGELLELAAGLSVRALRAALKRRARSAAAENGSTAAAHSGSASDSGSVTSVDDDIDDHERLCRLAVTVPIEDASMLEVTRILVEHVRSGWTGPASADGWLEALLAEGQGSLMNAAPPGMDIASEDLVDDLELLRAEREASMERRARAEARAERRVVEGRLVEAGEIEAGEAPEEEPLPGDALGMDRFLRQRSMELAGRELWLGKMLVCFFEADGWRRLGYATDTQYARERLGMSRAAAYKMMRLARRTRGFERIADAVGNGHLGTEAALLLVRVARPETEEAWVERAKGRTYKHLKEEVEQVEMELRLGGGGVGAGPPTAEAIAAHQDLMREVMTGELVRRALDKGATDAAVPMSAGPAEARDARAVASLGKVTLRFRVREETALFFRQLEQAYSVRAASAGRSSGFCAFRSGTRGWITWERQIGGRASTHASSTGARAPFASGATARPITSGIGRTAGATTRGI